MGISTSGYKREYTGDGSNTGPFSFPFYLGDSDDLKVSLDGVLQSGGFSTTGSGESWQVDFTTAPGSGVSILLRRETPRTQDSDYQQNDPIPAETVEGDFDYGIAIDQEIDGEKQNSIRFSLDEPSITDNQTVLAEVPASANSVIGFDTNGELTYFDLDTITNTVTNVVNTGEVDSINAQTGTSYTLVLGDKGAVVEMNNSSANTVTIPPFADVAFPVKTRLDITQIGTGTTTLAAGAGVTLNGLLNVRAQYHGITLYKRDTDEWVLIGGI